MDGLEEERNLCTINKTAIGHATETELKLVSWKNEQFNKNNKEAVIFKVDIFNNF